jgi:thioredoxin-like negative regulator of GroEL
MEVSGVETARLSEQSRELKPRLVFFYTATSGRCRRAEGFLAQVLQRRHNHETFDLIRVEETRHPELVERFRVTQFPTIYVVEGRRAVAKLELPTGCRDVEEFLQPWLR